MHHTRPLRLIVLPLLIIGSLGACAGGGDVVRVGSEIEPGVVYLGHRQVDFGVDRDVIQVAPYEGRFSALRVRVADAPVELYGIRVHFKNGETWSPETRLFFGRGEITRRIDLPGDDRAVRAVEFLYKSTRPRAGKARVQVFGIR